MKYPNPVLSILLVVSFLLPFSGAIAQTKSPESFLGYKIGERFTPYHRVHAYAEHVAATNDLVTLVQYGESYEGRPLIALFVSSPENINNLEAIRKSNLQRTGIESGTPTENKAIIWMSYNVHGNEAVSCETAMKTLWALIDPANRETKAYLENTVVVIDPCLNPDGQERYVNWYNQKANKRLQPDAQSLEHSEPWPGGRPNHYLYDLNRDWAWQVQKESKERIKFYNQWLPQVHVDFHEQGVNAPYFFAPAAEPIHEFVTPFQRQFQETIGRNNAKYFDDNAWMYFTREVFDLFYPSYGDSWPTFNGAIGMTYEQGGSGRAGLGIITAEGDTLTLADRILHHYTSGMATIETVSKHADNLVNEFAKYFNDHSSNPKGKYKTYVVKAGKTPDRLTALKKLLDLNGIKYGQAGARSGLSGYDYKSGKNASFAVESSDLIVSAYQPKSVLTQTLFEPTPNLSDSVTYDITSWALPYAYGLQAYALETRLDVSEAPASVGATNQVSGTPLAYIAPWNSTVHAKFLAALLNAGIRVRYADREFSFNDNKFAPGTLIIGRNGNDRVKDFHQKVVAIANEHQITLTASNTGYVDTGKDFGSSDVRPIIAPKVALLSGSATSSLNVGEVWHFFEQELDYPLAVLDIQQFGMFDLSKYTVIILPSGNYGSLGEAGWKKLDAWISSGGKLIAIDNALSLFSGKDGYSLSGFLSDDEKKAADKLQEEQANAERLANYRDRERVRISNDAAGAIFEVKVDATYPLGYGTDGQYFTLKNSGRRYGYLKNGVNVGIIPSLDHHRSGFIGFKAKAQAKESLVFGVENRGRGRVVYLVDNPMFRGFWESGKLLFSNAVFFVN